MKDTQIIVPVKEISEKSCLGVGLKERRMIESRREVYCLSADIRKSDSYKGFIGNLGVYPSKLRKVVTRNRLKRV